MSMRPSGLVGVRQRRRAFAVVAAGALVVTMAPAEAFGAGALRSATGATASVAAPATSSAFVTLITGDRVRVVTAADGTQNAYELPDPADRAPGVLLVRHDGDLSVFPVEALPYLRSGALDPALFDVTTLVEQGMDDASSDHLSVMATSPSSPLTTGEEATGATSPVPAAPPASAATTRAPWLGLVGLQVDKEAARDFWAALQASDPNGGADGEADFRRGVGKLWLDRRVEVSLDRSVGQIGAPAAYAEGLDGTGVTVAVIDTGIDDQHPDVAGSVIAQQDFTGQGTTDDLFGHGTHVASIIAGSGAQSGGLYRGVAPGVALLDARVLDEHGFGDESSIIAGMEWAAQQGADIANLSLGGWPTDGTDPMSAAVDALTAQYGTLFVIAAGNSGNGTPASNPGASTAALTVGSVGRTDALSDFSSGGPRVGDSAIKPEISAPGEDIVAAQADGTELGEVVAPGYVALSGTSMATPHVAGSAALLAERHPDWTAAQLKAALIASSSPIDAPVYRAGVGRVDVAAMLADEDLQVDAGTVSFGFLPWPHVDEQAVTRTLTYTNTGAADVTLDLAAALTEAISGDMLLDGAVKISPMVVTVPAGGSAPVEITVDPAVAGPGQWSGDLVATADDGRTVRTGLGFESESERYGLTVSVLGDDGLPTTADFFLINLETGAIASSWDLIDPTAPIRVAPGPWSVMVFATGGDDFGATVTAALADVTVAGDTEVVLDLRKAEQVRLAPQDSGVTQGAASLSMSRDVILPDGGGSGLVVGFSTFGPTALRALSTGPVGAGGLTFEVSTSWRVPAITASVVGRAAQNLDAVLMTADTRLDGDRTLRVRPAGKVGRGEVALAAATGEPLDAQVDAAKARGALAVIVSGGYPWFESAPALPVVWVPADEGASLLVLAQHRDGVRVHLVGQYRPTRVYDLVHSWVGEVPAGADLVLRRQDLALTRETYRSMAGDGDGRQTQLPWSLLGGFYASLPVPLGGTRLSYTSPEVAWSTALDYGSWVDPEGGAMPSATWWDIQDVAAAGHQTSRTWMSQIVRPAVPVTGTWSGRSGDDLWAAVPVWTDGAERAGDAWVLDEATWRLTSRGAEVASGQGPYVAATVPRRVGWYQLTVDTGLSADPTWRLSTATHTTWTFRSAHTAPEAESAQLALLAVDVKLPLRSDNTAPARQTMTFGVDVRAPEGVAASRVASLVVETSTDGGATWRRAEVRRTDADSFQATVHNGRAGDVALRVTATRADGTAVTQEVDAAYRVR